MSLSSPSDSFVTKPFILCKPIFSQHLIVEELWQTAKFQTVGRTIEEHFDYFCFVSFTVQTDES